MWRGRRCRRVGSNVPEYIPVEELKAANDPRWQALIDGVGSDEDESPSQFQRTVVLAAIEQLIDRHAGRTHRRRVPRRRDQHLPRPRPRPRPAATRASSIRTTPRSTASMAAEHRAALDPDDQRDDPPARHRPADRAAPDWLTMPGPHSLADLVDFLDASPSPFHAVESTIARRLDAAGFVAVSTKPTTWDARAARAAMSPATAP